MQCHHDSDPWPQAATPADHIAVHYDAQMYGRTLQKRQQALKAALEGADDVRRYQVQMQAMDHIPSCEYLVGCSDGKCGTLFVTTRRGTFVLMS